MNRTARPQLRRFAVTLVLAGTAALGTVAVAPIASAADSVAQDGGAYIEPGNGNGHGPDFFIVEPDGGRTPVFFCDDSKPNKRHNICTPVLPNGQKF
jgi:hypothetical protein